MHIRPASSTDLLSVLALQRAESNRLGFLPGKAVSELIDGGWLDVCSLADGGPIVGYICGRPSLRQLRHCGNIVQLTIAKPHRSRGYGGLLARHFLLRLHDGGSLFAQAWTRVDLTHASSLWQRLGCTPICERRSAGARRRRSILWRFPLATPVPADFLLPPRTSGHRNRTLVSDMLLF